MKATSLFPKLIMRMSLFFFVLLLILSSSNCRSKTSVRELITNTNTKINKKTQTKSINGITYNLPLTVVKVNVPMKMKKETPGEFSDFAPCYFSPEEADGRVITEKKEMSIDSPTFGSYGKADLSKTYVIQTTGGYFQNLTVSATYNKEGVLTDGSLESKDEALPFAIKIAEVVASLGIKALSISTGNSAGASGGPTLSPQELKNNLKEVFKDPLKLTKREGETICYLRGFEYSINKILKEIDLLTADANAEQDPEKKKEIQTKIKNLTNELEDWVKRYLVAKKKWEQLRSIENTEDLQYHPLNIQFDNAKKAFDDLTSLKKERQQFSQSNLQNINSEIFNSRLKELDEKIKTLTQAFLGKGEIFNWTGSFDVEPKKESEDVAKFFKVLFKYSKNNGVCYNDIFKVNLQKDGIIVPKEFQFDKCKTDDKDLLAAQVYIDRENRDTDYIKQIESAKSQMSKNETSGWYFRIPANAKISLIECKIAGFEHCPDDSKEYGQQITKIAQYGAIVSVPAKTAGRNTSMTIAIDETTGALKNFKASSSPVVDKSTVDNAGKIANEALDAADPLTKEKRRLDLLKTKNDINDEIKRASNSNTGNIQP